MSCVKSLLTKKAHDQRRLEEAIRNTSSAAAAAAAGAAAGNGRAKGDDEAEGMEVERTELEIATEAAVVRAKSTGRQARKELRKSMSRCVCAVAPRARGRRPARPRRLRAERWRSARNGERRARGAVGVFLVFFLFCFLFFPGAFGRLL